MQYHAWPPGGSTAPPVGPTCRGRAAHRDVRHGWARGSAFPRVARRHRKEAVRSSSADIITPTSQFYSRTFSELLKLLCLLCVRGRLELRELGCVSLWVPSLTSTLGHEMVNPEVMPVSRCSLQSLLCAEQGASGCFRPSEHQRCSEHRALLLG